MSGILSSAVAMCRNSRSRKIAGPGSLKAGSPTYSEASSGTWAASRELYASGVERRKSAKNSSEASGVKANSARKLCTARRFTI